MSARAWPPSRKSVRPGSRAGSDGTDDNDGTPDVDDDFPLDPTEDTDTDGDGTADTDDDNDGFTNDEEEQASSSVLDANSTPEDEDVNPGQLQGQRGQRRRRRSTRVLILGYLGRFRKTPRSRCYPHAGPVT